MEVKSPVSQWVLQFIALFLVTVVVGISFLQPPGLGDDLTYWANAFEIHEEGADAWDQNSFHDLRWPVWGVSWILQAALGPGLASFYGVPWLYLYLGACIAFVFGCKALGSRLLGWACALLYLFHPLLDTVMFRPMPDLSEGVIGGGVVLCWFGIMQSERNLQRWLLSVLCGLLIGVAYSNRITGVFIVPVICAGTLLIFPRQWKWLFVIGIFALLTFCIEAVIYQNLTGDFLHSIHANLGAKGKKGTESEPLWYLPFRFLDSLWKGNPLSPLYVIFSAIGIWVSWTKLGKIGKVTATWFVILYLEYSCGLQSFNPPRPLLRDADRFLAALAIPMAVLAVSGFLGVTLLLRKLKTQVCFERIPRYPALLLFILFGLLMAVTSRERFTMGYIPEFRSYTNSVASGTKVFTHRLMRDMVYLINPDAAKKIDWIYKSKILNRTDDLEAMAARSDEFWYIRKIVWLGTRKALEEKEIIGQEALGSYFSSPTNSWRISELIAKDDTPDFIFYRRKTVSDVEPKQFPVSVLGDFIPDLPLEWTKGNTKKDEKFEVPVEWRGNRVRMEADIASDEVEAATIELLFFEGEKQLSKNVLKPYFHPTRSLEFFVFEIPREADRGKLRLKISDSPEKVSIYDLRFILEEAPKDALLRMPE